MKRRQSSILLVLLTIAFVAVPGPGQQTNLSKPATMVGSGVSGPGTPVIGDGSGGWRSGSAGVTYRGAHPKPEWSLAWGEYATGSAVTSGLVPPIKPLMELQLRDTVIVVGGDGNYYMTGSSGDNIWWFNDGVELWRSRDLKKWSYLGVVWSIEKDGTWEKEWRDLHGKPARAIWAPELHYLNGNYYICLSLAPGGISILKSTTGRPDGPYVNALTENKPLANGIDPTLFRDDDGKIYFTYSNPNKIARMKDDLSGLAEDFRTVVLADPDRDPTHHNEKCIRRGAPDIGHEGASLFKANGKYYLGAADDYQGRYSSVVAIADNVYGPYHMRHEAVPSGGGTNYFKDKQGNWWCAFFGNDEQVRWREKPGIVRIGFAKDGRIVVAKHQPKWILAK